MKTLNEKSQRSTKTSISHELLKLEKRPTTRWKEELKSFKTHVETFPHTPDFARYKRSNPPPKSLQKRLYLTNHISYENV